MLQRSRYWGVLSKRYYKKLAGYSFRLHYITLLQNPPYVFDLFSAGATTEHASN